MKKLKKLIEKICDIETTNLFGNDFINTWEKTTEEIEQILLIAQALKIMRSENIATKMFENGLAVSIFKDNSTRTRFSFAFAANLLGLSLFDLDETRSQIAHGETVRETANMISFMTEVIGIRDDIYLGVGEKYMRQVAAALDDGFINDVLPQRPIIVNLQSDVDHPTQTLADLMHLITHFGDLESLRGKKIAVTWAYSPSYGKPLSVPQGIIGLLSRFGMNISLAYPEGYNLIPEIEQMAANYAQESGGSFEIVNSMEEAFKDADIVYPKSWAPYWVMQQRTNLLENKDLEGLKELEKQALAENAKHRHWETTIDKINLTHNASALYMHPLPADISGVSCETGEVSNEVFELYRIQTYKQASWKPYIIAAIILASKTQNPADLLEYFLKKEKRRLFFK